MHKQIVLLPAPVLPTTPIFSPFFIEKLNIYSIYMKCNSILKKIDILNKYIIKYIKYNIKDNIKQ